MKTKCISKLFLISLGFLVGLSFFANAEPPAGDWILVSSVSDEFDGTSLDTTKWGYGEKPWGTTDNGVALITPEDTYLSSWDGSDDGVLVLRERMGDFEGYSFTTGWAWTKLWFTGGYMEIRAQYPAGLDQWPAWWMLMDGWPPEFDIAEYRGAPRDYLTQAFCWLEDGSEEWSGTSLYGDFTGWRTYGFEWGPGYLKWYLDGELTKTFTGDVVPSDDMYVILSAGLDDNADASTGFPNYYVIDYFRLYQTDTHPGVPAPPTDLTAVPEAGGIFLDWNRPSDWDLSHYNVYSSITSGGPYTLVATDVLEIAYTDTGLTNGTTYYYVVTAVDNDTNESVYSNEASATAVDIYSVTVENYSFELPGTEKQTDWDDVPGWSSDSASDSGVETSSAASDGSWIGFLKSGDASVWQMTGYTIAAQQMFILDVDGISTYYGENLKLSLYYLDGTDRIELGSTTASVGTSMDRYSLVCYADDVPDSVGQTIGIQIDNTDSSTSWLGFDNVRLSYGADTRPPEPAAPTGLSAVAGDVSVSLNWADNGEPDLASYTVYRSATSGSGYSSIATGVAVSDYVDNAVTNGLTYYYVVTAVDQDTNESGYSNEASATPVHRDPITIVGSTAGSEQAINSAANSYDGDETTRWSNDATLDNAWIEYDLGDSYYIDQIKLLYYKGYRTYPIKIEIDGVEVFNGDSGQMDTDYWETLFAVTYGRYVTITMTASNSDNNDWFSIYETEIWGPLEIPDTTPPAAPTGLSTAADNGSVSLDWDNNGESDLASYTVYRSITSGSGYASIATGVATSDYVDSTVDKGTTYYYVVVAVDTSSNESENSNEAFAPEYKGDLTIDGRVDLEDMAELSSGWQTSYDMALLLDVANDWLEGI